MKKTDIEYLKMSIDALNAKVDRLMQTMEPQPSAPLTNLDLIDKQIQEFGLDPVQAYRDAGLFRPKRRGRRS